MGYIYTVPNNWEQKWGDQMSRIHLVTYFLCSIIKNPSDFKGISHAPHKNFFRNLILWDDHFLPKHRFKSYFLVQPGMFDSLHIHTLSDLHCSLLCLDCEDCSGTNLCWQPKGLWHYLRQNVSLVVARSAKLARPPLFPILTSMLMTLMQLLQLITITRGPHPPWSAECINVNSSIFFSKFWFD